ncbi:MAG: hypothetical protein AABX48_04870 [Nanoarchaeota archaeon]
MINIILIIFVIIAVIYLFNSYQNKYQNFQGVLFNFVIIMLLVFLLFTVSYVYSNTNPDLSNFSGVVNFIKVYFSWLGSFFGNTKNIAGYATKQNWVGNLTGK